MTQPNGLLLVNKPKGWTSHDVVGRMRKLAGTKKVGHTGTLDPDATGLLPITLGACTKLAQYLTLDVKEYEFSMQLGSQTDTDDHTGEVLHTSDAGHVTLEQLREALSAFDGEVMQRPPNYSAIRVNGQRAYALARAGVEFELPERPVYIHELELLSTDLPNASLRLRCGAGTYVRSIARDLGHMLGTHGHSTSIHRTGVGAFRVEKAVTLEQLEANGVESYLLPPGCMVESLERWDASAVEIVELRHGRAIEANIQLETDTLVAIFDAQHSHLIAMARTQRIDDNLCLLKPKRVLQF